MPDIGGALGGAASGAQIGSFAGPWGTAIGAGIGGLIGLFTGGKSKLQKNVEGTWGPVKDNLINWSGENMDSSRAFKTLGLGESQASDKYLRSLLSSNDTTALDALLGPQREGIAKSYQQVLNNISNFAPRGGGRSAAGMTYDFDKAGAQLDEVAKARAGAVDRLTQLAGQNTNAGLQFGQQATNQEATVMNSIGSMLGTTSANARAQGQANGASAYQLGQQLGPLLGKIFSKGGGSLSGGGVWEPVGPGE